MENKKIGVIGFGYIGTCIGAVLAGRGYGVTGIDVSPEIVRKINRGITSIAEPGLAALVAKTVKKRKLSASADFAALAGCDVVIITVGTPLGKNFEPDTSNLVSAVRALRPHLKKGQLVILKSTVPPWTTEKVVKPILDKAGVSYSLAFCPERLAEGRAIAEFESIPIIVGGIDAQSTQHAAGFWKEAMGVAVHELSSARAAELVKLADNLWIDLNIALANELAMLSDAIDADVLEIIAAANSLPKGRGKVNILFPGYGVGGYCLTKDPWFVHHLGEQFGMDLKTPQASRSANDLMPHYTFDCIESAMKEAGKSLQGSKVAVLGISFKSNTGDCRYSPAKEVVDRLVAAGSKLELFDPWVSDEEALVVTSRKLNRDLGSTLTGADALVFLTGHDQFKRISAAELQRSLKPHALIFDGRNMLPVETIAQTRAIGFIYKGIGR